MLADLTGLDMRFIEIKVINYIDPQNCLINYLDPVLLEKTRPGDAKHKINFPSPYLRFYLEKSLRSPVDGNDPGTP